MRWTPAPWVARRRTRWQLARAHGEAIAARWNVPVVVALHAPSTKGDQRNDHVHLVFATRKKKPINSAKKLGC